MADEHTNRPIVLITGASGFIAQAVIERLGTGYTVVGLDRPGPPTPRAPAIEVGFDLSSDQAVRKSLDDVRRRFGDRIASVIHLAAYYDVSGQPNPLYDEVTVQGTRRLIDALQDFTVEQFIFASTMLVHRATQTPTERIREDSPIAPSWAYPESKVKTEALLRERRGKIPVVALRIAGVYEDDGRSPFLAEQIARVYEHRLTSHFYPGMLCAAQSFIHRQDLAEAIARVVERRGELPAELPLLVGEPDPPGYGEIQDIIGEALHGERWKTIRIPKPLAKAGVAIQNEVLGSEQFIQPWMVESSNDHYILDIARARTLLGWEPTHHLRDVLPKMVAALKRDPEGWYRLNKLNANLVAWADKSGGHGGKAGAEHRHSADAGHGGRSITAEGGERAANPQVPGATNTPAMDHGTMDHGAMGHNGMDHDAGGKAGMDMAGMDMAGMDHSGHMATMERDERRARWAHYANIGLGLWLASSPLIYDAVTSQSVSDTVLAVTTERNLPSVEVRAAMLSASDIASGLLLALFGAFSLRGGTKWWAQWGAAFVGIWLLFAPLIFWSPSAAQYNMNLLVGALAIAFSVLVPMMPGMSMAGMMDPKTIPPGWTYSPSTDAQRLPIAAMGLIGLIISRYLTAYQLGHTDAVWEPFFQGSAADPRNGTEEIITSYVSTMWPIPDAGLGAVSYMLEILMAVMGTRDRWRTMPWMVSFFGILVIPLGVVSIYFIIIQPLLLGTWSTLALMAALAMLIMIPFALDEVIAMSQFLHWAHCRGKPLIRTFFKGDAVDAGTADPADVMTDPQSSWNDARRGLTLPWTLAASIAVGVLLMLSRLLVGAEGAIANTHHVLGALAITVAIIALAEVARALRFINVVLGAWAVASPFLYDGGNGPTTVLSIAAGLLLIGLALPKGRRSGEHYASWDKFIV